MYALFHRVEANSTTRQASKDEISHKNSLFEMAVFQFKTQYVINNDEVNY